MTHETGHEYRFEGALPNARRDSITPSWWRRPSIFMPRAASRITLEVTDVRAERLQDISETDAIAEGCPNGATRPIDWYRTLWDDLNAARGFGWDTSPWVWVVEFRRIKS